MISDCLQKDKSGEEALFGITCSNEHKTFLSGCTVVIEQVLNTYSDGKLDILTRGKQRYSTLEILTKTPYPSAHVEFFDDIEEEVDPDLVNETLSLHSQLLEIAQGSPAQIQLPENQLTSFFVAHSAGLELEQRQTLLDCKSENQRLQYLIAYYRQILPRARNQQQLKAQIMLNGHLRVLKSQEIK
jgi:Lon protease-like protein